MQILDSRRFVPEEFRNCRNRPLAGCIQARKHVCFANFSAIPITNQLFIGQLRGQFKDLLQNFRVLGESLDRKHLSLIYGSEILSVLQGTSYRTLGISQYEMIELRKTLKRVIAIRNVICHAFSNQSRDVINVAFRDMFLLRNLLKIKQ